MQNSDAQFIMDLFDEGLVSASTSPARCNPQISTVIRQPIVLNPVILPPIVIPGH